LVEIESIFSTLVLPVIGLMISFLEFIIKQSYLKNQNIYNFLDKCFRASLNSGEKLNFIVKYVNNEITANTFTIIKTKDTNWSSNLNISRKKAKRKIKTNIRNILNF
jgi:hypothetical protein